VATPRCQVVGLTDRQRSNGCLRSPRFPSRRPDPEAGCMASHPGCPSRLRVRMKATMSHRGWEAAPSPAWAGMEESPLRSEVVERPGLVPDWRSIPSTTAAMDGWVVFLGLLSVKQTMVCLVAVGKRSTVPLNAGASVSTAGLGPEALGTPSIVPWKAAPSGWSVRKLGGRDRSDAWDAAPGALGSLGRAGRGMSAAGHQGTPPEKP